MSSKRIIFVLFLCFWLCLFVGCGNSLQEGVSPKLVDYSLYGECDGDENSQFVVLTLKFDNDINCEDDFLDDLRITIADERQKSKDCKIQQDTDNSVTVRIPVTAITNGILHVEPLESGKPISGIRQAAEGAPAYPFTIDALIPSGIELKTKASGNSTVTKQVVGTWNIRSITWIQLWDNGEQVEPLLSDSLEILDGSVAVHGHDFLYSDEVVIAEEIAETLQGFYGNEYQFKADGDTVTVTASQQNRDLDLAVYNYHEMSVEGVQ